MHTPPNRKRVWPNNLTQSERQMNKMAIRMSWLRSDSVDIGFFLLKFFKTCSTFSLSFFFKFFWQMNKWAIRLSWLKSYSVDNGLVFLHFFKNFFNFFSFFSFKFFWQMNKSAIRLSWLRSDSVDIVGVHRIWKSYGWPSYVFNEYVYTWECWGLLWIWEVMDSTSLHMSCLRVYTDLCHFQRGLAWQLKSIGQGSHFFCFLAWPGSFLNRVAVDLKTNVWRKHIYNKKILKNGLALKRLDQQ